ncbi:MAG: hypothetical protein HYW48_08930 [Deltaproteobacteria bacterium]|nr:hypothetical protein [Deltaproteobacteria bacterium]
MAIITRWLVVSWITCLVPRLAVVFVTSAATDYTYFQNPAISLNSYWYPLYKIIAATLWMVSCHILPLYIFFHVCLHALIGPLVYFLTQQLKLSNKIAWLSVAGVAFLPYYVSMASQQPQAGIVVTLFAGMIVSFMHWHTHGYKLKSGLIFALLSFLIIGIRSNTLILVCFFYGFGIWHFLKSPLSRQTWLKKMIPLFLSGFCLAGLLGLLSLKMYRDTGHFKPFPPLSGYNLYLSNNALVPYYAKRYYVSGYLEELEHDHGLPANIRRETDPYIRDRLLAKIAFTYMYTHPIQTLANFGWKTIRYWDIRLDDANNTSFLKNLLYTLPYTIYVLLALVGSAILYKQNRFAFLIVQSSIILFWLPHVLYQGVIRNRMTTEFLLLILASVAVCFFLKPIKNTWLEKIK